MRHYNTTFFCDGELVKARVKYDKTSSDKWPVTLIIRSENSTGDIFFPHDRIPFSESQKLHHPGMGTGVEGKEEIMENWPQWLKDANTVGAKVEIVNGNVIWHGGEWFGGEWHGGEWFGGVWHGGEWHGGIWHGGIWRGGEWHGGEWHGGIWHGGIWRGGDCHVGVWHGGEWYGGEWYGGEWRGGEWYGGEWYGGEWHGGVWCGGEWHGGEWHGGIWRGGDWHGGIWRGGIWHGGIWRGGDCHVGVWYGGEWRGGEWYGGEWHGGVWRGGVWRGGEWYGGEWHGGEWRGGEWRGGEWRGGEWRGGEWRGGEWKDTRIDRLLFHASMCGIHFNKNGYAIGYRSTRADGSGRYISEFKQPEGKYYEEDCKPAGSGTCCKGIHVAPQATALTYFGIDTTAQLWEVKFHKKDLLDCDGQKARIRGGVFKKIDWPFLRK